MGQHRDGTTFGILASASGAVAVLAGAFGAHALRERLGARSMEVFEKAVHWQAVHALALLAVAVLSTGPLGARAPRALKAAGLAFAVGTVLFSGSLYALALAGARWLGAITPVGGVAFVVGWVALATAFARAGGRRSDGPDRPDGEAAGPVR